MSAYAGPEIVNGGLVMCVDAANAKSYPGSGTTWFDLSGNSNHLTLVGSPVFTSGIVQFNGSTQHADNTLNLSGGTSTVIGASRYSGATRGRIITSKINNWLLGAYSSSTETYYAEGWIVGPGVGANDTNWRIYAGTSNAVNDTYSFYLNGTLSVSNSNGSAGPNGISLGKSGVYPEYSTCEVSFVLAYNRVLTEREIQQNFNAYRGRFGI